MDSSYDPSAIADGITHSEYLVADCMMTRHVVARHFLRDCRTILDVGGYQTPIHLFLEGGFDKVTVIDPLIKPYEGTHSSGGAIRHVRGLLDEHDPTDRPDGLLFLGTPPPQVLCDAGNREVLAKWILRSRVAIVEFPNELYELKMGFVELIRDLELIVDTRINFDFTHNQLPASSSPYKPFLKRSLFVLRPLGADDRHPQPNTEHWVNVILGEINVRERMKYRWFPRAYALYGKLRQALRRGV